MRRRQIYLLVSIAIGALLGCAVIVIALLIAHRGYRPPEPPVAIAPIEWSLSAPRPPADHLPSVQKGAAVIPDPQLIEIAPEGLLPIRGETGATSFHSYRRLPAPAGSGQTALPQVAIILKEAGIGQLATLEASLRLAPDISLALSPYARDLDRQVDDIREAGHEYFIDVPVMAAPSSQKDRGPKALAPDLSEAENLIRLKWAMTRVTGYIGLLTLTETGDALPRPIETLVSQQSAARGLGVVFDQETEKQRRLIPEILQAGTDQFLKREMSAAQIDAALKALEHKAQAQGHALGVAVLTPLAIERIRLWSEGLSARHIRLVPASALVKSSGP